MAETPSDNVWIGDLPPELEKAQLDQVFGAYGTITQSKLMPPKNPGQKAQAMIRFSSVEEAKWIVESLNGNLVEGLPEEPIKAAFAWNNQNKGGDKGGDKGGGKVGGKGGGPYNSWGGKGDQGGGWNKGGGDQDGGWNKGGGDGGWNKGGGDGGWNKGGGWDGGKGKGGKKGGPSDISMVKQAAKELFKQSLGESWKIPDDQQVFVGNLPPDTKDEDLYGLFAPFGAIAPTGVKAMMNPDGTCKGYGFVDFLSNESALNAVTVLSSLQTWDGGKLQLNLKTQKAEKAGKGNGATVTVKLA